MPERTVRAWLAAIRREVAQELREREADELLLAVEAVRHVAVAAWAAYEREADRELADATDPKLARRAGPALRYLILALADLAGDPDDFPTDSQNPAGSAEIAAIRTTATTANTTHSRNPAESAPRSALAPQPSPDAPLRGGEGGAPHEWGVGRGVGSPKSAPPDTTAAPEPARAGFVAARPPVAASAASHLPQPSQTRQKRQNRQKPRPSRRYPVRATFILKAPTR